MSPSEEKTESLSYEVDTSTLPNLVKDGLLGHQWVQRGAYLHCVSCPILHGVYIGVDRILVGINDDGTPKLKKIN